MAKSKLGLGKILMGVAALLGIVAIFMMLLSGVTVTTPEVLGMSASESAGTGFELMFGTQTGMNFNFMMFLPFVLVIVGIAGVVLSFLNLKLGKLIALAAFAVAGVLFFCFGAFYPMCADGLDTFVDTLKKAGGSVAPGIGAIMAGIFSLVAAAGAALATFMFKN